MKQGKGPFGLGRSRANVDTPALLSVVSGRPGLQAREASYPYPHPSHSTGSCAGRGKCTPLMAAGVGRMDQTSAGRELAENWLTHAMLPPLGARNVAKWDPHEEGLSPDLEDPGHLGARLGEESVLSGQPLPVALTIGAKEDEINRRVLSGKYGKGLLSRVGAKGGVRPPAPQASEVHSEEEGPTAFGKWIIDSAMQEARDADEEMGSQGGEERFEFNSPTPLDLQSAAIVNQAMSRAEPSLETVVGEQELPEGAGVGFAPAPEDPQLG